MTKMLSETEVRELIEKLKKELEFEPHRMGEIYYLGMIRVLKFVVGDAEGYLVRQ